MQTKLDPALQTTHGACVAGRTDSPRTRRLSFIVSKSTLVNIMGHFPHSYKVLCATLCLGSHTYTIKSRQRAATSLQRMLYNLELRYQTTRKKLKEQNFCCNEAATSTKTVCSPLRRASTRQTAVLLAAVVHQKRHRNLSRPKAYEAISLSVSIYLKHKRIKHQVRVEAWQSCRDGSLRSTVCANGLDDDLSYVSASEKHGALGRNGRSSRQGSD